MSKVKKSQLRTLDGHAIVILHFVLGMCAERFLDDDRWSKPTSIRRSEPKFAASGADAPLMHLSLTYNGDAIGVRGRTLGFQPDRSVLPETEHMIDCPRPAII